MGTKLYVGNLPFNLSEEELTRIFEEVAPVSEVKFIYDSFDGHFRGYGFVSLTMDQDVDRTVQTLDGHEIKGRAIRVASAHSNDRNKIKIPNSLTSPRKPDNKTI